LVAFFLGVARPNDGWTTYVIERGKRKGFVSILRARLRTKRKGGNFLKGEGGGRKGIDLPPHLEQNADKKRDRPAKSPTQM